MEDHIWKKAILYTTALQRTHMSRRETGVLYPSCFLPAITYPLLATWLSDRFLERVMKLSTSTILNKMRLHRNLPRAMVFAPRHVGGLGLLNLIHEQGAQKILILLQHLCAKTPLGTAMEVLIRTYQLWAGMRNQILCNTQPCSWIPEHWLSHLRTFMHSQCIQIIYDAWTFLPLHHQDRFIMNNIIELNLPQNKMEQLNACRMYLQVTTLAEIMDHTGQMLLPHVLSTVSNPTPQGLQNISQSTLTWPQIANPSPSCWRYWTTMIRRLYTGLARGMQLEQPLGNWHATIGKSRFWNWKLNDATHLLYHASTNAPTRMGLRTQQWRSLSKYSTTIPSMLPFDGTPITPLNPNTGYVKLPTLPIEKPNETPPETGTGDTLARQFRQQMHPWQRPMFGSLRKAGNNKNLIKQLLAERPIMTVSDASIQKNNNSGFAWVIAQENATLWRRLGIAPGLSKDIYSGHAEAYGILAAITFLQYYLQIFDTIIP